jgi:hypothetical protein
VANCNIPFEDLVHRDQDSSDFWVWSPFSISLLGTWNVYFVYKL